MLNRTYLLIMKELKGIFIFSLITGFIVFVLINLLVNSIFSLTTNYWNVILTGIIVSVVFAVVLQWVVYSLLKAKLNFLESEETQVPDFGDKQQRVIPVESANFSFEVIKYRIKENYHIAVYDDIEHHVLKFRSKLMFNGWGTAGVVTYNAVSRKLTLTCFPFCAHTEKAAKNTQQMFDKVEKLLY